MTSHIAIIGAGPVGLVAALSAARAGHRTTLIDPRTGAIDKACGEGLMPGALARLNQLGLDPEGRPLRGVKYLQKHRFVEHRFPGTPGRGVRRTTLHTLLSEAGERDGVTRITAGVKDITQTADSVTLATGDGEQVTADYVLACDGLHSPTARRLGLNSPGRHRPGKRRFGLRQHFAVAPWSDVIEVHYLSDVEIYITPVADDEVGVAILGPQGLSLDAAIEAVPELASRLAGASPTSTLRGAGPFPHATTKRVAGRVLLVGDASGYVDAITGEGLRVGFDQAHTAVEAITADDPEGYEKTWKHTTRPFRVLTAGLTALATSPLRPAIVPAAHAMPKLFGSIVNRLAK